MMPDVAYIFPGQGAQYVGMGEDFYHRYEPAKQVFDLASQSLGFDIAKLIFQGPIEELTSTINCQVAVFTVSIACLRAWEGSSPEITVKYTAGLSLGEYTALVAAGALSFTEGLTLVRARAEYMQQASQENPGGMLSIIGLKQETVEEICAQTQAEVANLNCPGQVVISGSPVSLKQAEQKAQAAGAQKIIPLQVSGAFHSSLMAAARQRLAERLKQARIGRPRMPVISNVTAKEEMLPEEIRENLARQLVSRTRWQDSVRFIAGYGVRVFLEVGPGKVLRGLLRKIDPNLRVYNIERPEDLKLVNKEL